MKINYDFIKVDVEELPLQPNGFLNVLANITRTGVFTYFEKSPDGTVKVIRQLRHPDEVFAEQTLNTLLGLPVTENHPADLVNTENVKDLVVGMTSDRPKKISLPDTTQDGEEYVQQLVTFFNKDTIQKIMDKKKKELSLGYECVLDESPGEWNGVKYDYVQREIKYNHLSLVDRARGGAHCRVLVDEKEKEVICDGFTLANDNFKEEVEMKVILHDGKEYKVEDDVYEVFSTIQKSLDDAQSNLESKDKELQKVTAIRDDYASQLGQIDKEKEANDFTKAVQAKVELINRAQKVLKDDDLSKLTDSEIKKKVVEKLRPEVNLDGKSEDYVDARFEVCLEDYKPKAQSDEEKMGETIKTTDGISLEDKRNQAWKRDKELWKPSK